MKQILYIDDEIKTLKMSSKLEIIEAVLDRNDVEFLKAASVTEAIEVLEAASSVVLIIIDLIMPPLDRYSLEKTNGGTLTGLELLKEIRERRPNLKIMIVSIRNKNRFKDYDYIMDKYKISEFVEKHKVTSTELGAKIKRIIGEL